jgi:sulfopyruvate decarboxylase TPP-binding subunit
MLDEIPRKVGVHEDALDWRDQVFAVLKVAKIRQVGYVPDAGHARLIELCRDDPGIRAVALTSEEEGVRCSPEPGSAGSVGPC